MWRCQPTTVAWSGSARGRSRSFRRSVVPTRALPVSSRHGSKSSRRDGAPTRAGIGPKYRPAVDRGCGDACQQPLPGLAALVVAREIAVEEAPVGASSRRELFPSARDMAAELAPRRRSNKSPMHERAPCAPRRNVTGRAHSSRYGPKHRPRTLSSPDVRAKTRKQAPRRDRRAGRHRLVHCLRADNRFDRT